MHPILISQLTPARTIYLCAFLLHLLTSQLPLVNQEWVFIDAARYFLKQNPVLLEEYFSYQANTLGMPILVASVAKLLPGLNISTVYRMVSATSILLLGEAIIRANQLITKGYNTQSVLLCVLVNPLIWTFAGRATADLFPASLAIFSVVLFWEASNNAPKAMLAMLGMGLAITLKYHALLLLPLVVTEQFTRKHRKISLTHLLLRLLAILIIPASYVLAVKYYFNYWFTPDNFHEMLRFNFANLLNNLLAYLGYLGILLLPLSLSPIITVPKQLRSHIRQSLLRIVVFSSAFGLGYYGVKPQGEMNFGPLDSWLTPAILGGGFCVMATLLLINLVQTFKGTPQSTAIQKRYLRCILLTLIVMLSLLSCTRPAQRYLLFILPFSYFFILKSLTKQTYIILSLVFSMLLNLYLTGNQYVTGQAAQLMVTALQEKALIQETDGDVLLRHVGNAFFKYSLTPKKYRVTTGDSSNILFSVTSDFLLWHKSYALALNP